MADDNRPWKKRRDDEDDRDDERDERPRRKRPRDDEDDDFGGYDDDSGRQRKLSRETLRGIAGNQKAIILCILVYICLIPINFVIPEEARIFLALALIPLGIAATVFVFLLATKVYTTTTGVIFGILTLVPCIGLIVLLIINGKATSVLQENGVRVGFLGANSSSI